MARGQLVLLCVAILATGVVRAEDVTKRWRMGFGLGGYSPQSQIESDSANVLRLYSPAGRVQAQYIDPRPDGSAFNTLGIRPGPIAYVSGQYAVTRHLVLEASAGYSRTDVGNVEIHARFDIPDSLDTFEYQFEPFLITAGEADIYPLQFSAIARFRPLKRFNPYVGAGIGYQFVDYAMSSELETISKNLENSVGKQSYMIPGAPEERPYPFIYVSPNAPARNLQGAYVDLPDSFTWHGLLGAEFSFGPRWSAFVDLRYVWSASEATIAFNGEEDLGIAVPDGQDFVGSPAQGATYGPMFITVGGLIDGGQRRPRPIHPPDTDCTLEPFKCSFDRNSPDGVPDNGFYYINGGTFDYSSFVFTFGTRYTF